ncbi:hypothetical protein [Pseudooceanicola nanhaiensis]|uniref:hypothetical protein n=1 Tax=Pseudooceanicola nanhaiensis TaxID=375761 RepID=UPI001CD3A6B5|nr:hypothetical protein [Pseudooceanicola nanhaiensis]MCA0922220.1 hypothetical protein [Pseudooceanicola nanhaiensis]
MKKAKLTLAALLFSQATFALPVHAQSPNNSDLQALRFYLAEDNQEAVRSEIRRLQLRYPDWVVPEDLSELEAQNAGDAIDRIYAQIEAGNFSVARDLIEQTRRDFPSWTPSDSLMSDLTIAEAQQNFDQVVGLGDANAAIRIANDSPELLRCERINNAWLLAEQYIAIGDTDAAMRIQNGVVRSCNDPDILVATLEKSASIASASDLSAMADTARAQAPVAADRLTAVENRLLAGMGASARDGSSASTDTASAGSTRPGGSTSTTRPPSSGGGSSAGLSAAARAAARGDWQSCLAATAGGGSASVLSQRGWCALNSGRPMQALTDFRDAAARGNGTTRRDASYGLALTLLNLNMVNEAASVAASTRFTAQQRLDIESQILDKRGVAAFERKDFRRAIAYFNELERLTGVVRRDLALLRGYAYLNSGDRTEARRQFLALHNQLATPASRRALASIGD